MKEISTSELSKWRIENLPHQLIDVREVHEVLTCTIGGQHIPMAEVAKHIDEIRKDIPVVIHCRSGKRSAAVAHSLEQKFGFENLYSLRGGILAWIDEVDQTLAKY